MKWVVLPYSEPYTEETKSNEVKIDSFSCNQEYYLTKSIKKCIRIIYNFSIFLYANILAESTSYAPTFLCLNFGMIFELHVTLSFPIILGVGTGNGGLLWYIIMTQVNISLYLVFGIYS